MIKNVICYGAGETFKSVVRMLNPNVCDVIAVIDKITEKEIPLPKFGLFWKIPQKWGGGKTLSIQSIKSLHFDYILICSDLYYVQMKEALLKQGIPSEKIIIASHSEFGFDYRNINQSLYCKMNNSKNHKILRELTDFELFDHIVCRELMLRRERHVLDFQVKSCEDYVRVSTIELIANRIIEQNIIGNIAEVGVFQGTISALLNEMFPKRKLYLFDTFDSFNAEVMSKEKISVSEPFIDMFKATSTELVMSKMRYPDNCVIRKGVFPDTANELREEKWAFVSLDVDLYESTYAGLKYFYPRMQKHGYIIIHDCLHHQEISGKNVTGAGKAVEVYCRENDLQYVPLTDVYGSVVLVK